MRIQLASDLHLEMRRGYERKFLGMLTPEPDLADTLVLAGDVFSAKTPTHGALVFSLVAPKYKHVVYVPGNHEFYGTDLPTGWASIKSAAALFANVHALDNEEITLDGVKFFGGTGWFPSFHGDPIAVSARHLMNDFRLIRELDQAAHGSNWDFDVKLAGAEADVVVSHHLPSKECVAPMWRRSALNAFFVSDFDVAGTVAKLWLHGHTHEQVDLTLGATRVVANPLGYPNEGRQCAVFDPRRILTV